MSKLDEFKQGMKELTPRQIIFATLLFNIGMMVGLVIGIGGFIYSLIKEWSWTSFGFCISTFFGLCLMYITSYYPSKKQYKELKLMEQRMEAHNELRRLNGI